MSSYLDQPLRSEAEVHRERREARLRVLADRLERGAHSNSHTIANPQRAKLGADQADEAFALRRTLRENAELRRENAVLRRQLDPLVEGPRQILAEITTASR